MSEAHFDEYEHYNYDQDKQMFSGHSGKQRSKKEAEQNTNKHNPAGHERKILTKLQNMEAKAKLAPKTSNSSTNGEAAEAKWYLPVYDTCIQVSSSTLPGLFLGRN